jgi:transcriptional accessory protein Tex/SPT6
MALNRGEKLKILSIKITAHHSLQKDFLYLCYNTFNLQRGQADPIRRKVCDAAFNDAWDRLVLPMISRHVQLYFFNIEVNAM